MWISERLSFVFNKPLKNKPSKSTTRLTTKSSLPILNTNKPTTTTTTTIITTTNTTNTTYKTQPYNNLTPPLTPLSIKTPPSPSLSEEEQQQQQQLQVDSKTRICQPENNNNNNDNDKNKKTIEISIVSASQVAKSAAIRLGFKDVRLIPSKYKDGQTYCSQLDINDTAYNLHMIKLDDKTMIDLNKHPPEIRSEYSHFGGGVVCYDASNRDSMDCLPDLLNAFVTLKVPIFLVGLLTDLKGNHQTDPELGRKLATLFGVQLLLIDVYTHQGAAQMQNVYTALAQKIIQSEKQKHQYQLRRPISCPPPMHQYHHQQKQKQQQQLKKKQSRHSTIYLYNTNQQQQQYLQSHEKWIKPQQQQQQSYSNNNNINNNNLNTKIPRSKQRFDLLTLSTQGDTTDFHHETHNMPTPPLSPIQSPLVQKQHHSNFNTCQSTALDHEVLLPPSGVTVDAIINKLLLWDFHDHETSMLIFLTFYRKFMSPYQLLLSLMERFEQDLNAPNQPTRNQERIRTIICLWLSQYWSDVYYGTTYKTLARFLQRLSHIPDLQNIYQILHPLITRPLPIDDPDALWGLTDDDQEQSESNIYDIYFDSETSSYLNLSHKLNNQHHDRPLSSNSFLSSSSFSSSYSTTSTTSSPNKSPSPSWINELNKMLAPTTTTTASFSSPSAHTIESKEEDGQNDNSNSNNKGSSLTSTSPCSSSSSFSSSIHESNNIIMKKKKKKSRESGDMIYNSDSILSFMSFMKRNSRQSKIHYEDDPILFGGGLSMLDSIRPSFSSPSLKKMNSNSKTNRRQQQQQQQHRKSAIFHPSVRHSSNLRYAMLMSLSIDLIAEQLTWIEIVLFKKLTPRDFIRHLWGEKGASEAMLISISHDRFITRWVETMVLSQNHLCQRVGLLEKFIVLADKLYHYHRNYNTLMSIMKGLEHLMTIFKDHPHPLDQEKHDIYKKLVTLMQPDKNYLLYRQDVEKLKNEPCLPYLWLHRQDLVILAETKRDITSSGTVHWEKFRTMGEAIFKITQNLSCTSTIQPNNYILQFLSDTDLLNEEELQHKITILQEN